MVDFAFNLNNFEYFLLILVRIASFVYVAPFFGNSAVPRQTKIGLSAFVALLLYNVLDKPELNYVSLIGYTMIVGKEVLVGLMIGFMANICSSIILFSGNIIDMDIGLSMATEFNADTNTEATITGNFYYYLVLLLLLVSDMHKWILRALCDSYEVVPINGAEFNWDSIVVTATKFMMDLCIIGFRIFLPVFACIMILNCILGIMAKVAPQMNMFAVGIQMKVLVGFTVLLLTIFLLPNISDFIMTEMKKMVVMIIEGMYTS